MFNPRSVQQARLRTNMSQADLAYRLRDLGIAATERSIRRWESGDNEPRANVIPAIAEATGHAIEFFYTGTEDDEPDLEAALMGSLRALVRQAVREAVSA